MRSVGTVERLCRRSFHREEILGLGQRLYPTLRLVLYLLRNWVDGVPRVSDSLFGVLVRVHGVLVTLSVLVPYGASARNLISNVHMIS